MANPPVRSAFPLVIAALGAFLIFWFVVSETYVDRDDAPAAAAADRPSLEEHRAAQKAKLEEAAVLDREQGRVRLPIERAMELVVAEESDS